MTVHVLDVLASQIMYKTVTSSIRVFQLRNITVTASRTFLVYVGYLHRQYAIVFVNMVYVPDDHILVLSCNVNIVEQW
jgi:hypothetical protein